MKWYRKQSFSIIFFFENRQKLKIFGIFYQNVYTVDVPLREKHLREIKFPLKPSFPPEIFSQKISKNIFALKWSKTSNYEIKFFEKSILREIFFLLNSKNSPIFFSLKGTSTVFFFYINFYCFMAYVDQKGEKKRPT